MKKHLKKAAIAVAVVVALTGGVILYGNGGGTIDPPGSGTMVHSILK